MKLSQTLLASVTILEGELMQYIQHHYYHIYNRGNNRQPIFLEDDNYIYLLKMFKEKKDKYSITILAYCLMPNHYHLFLRQDGTHPISNFLKTVFQSYVQAFNKKYQRSGKLFEGNAQGKAIDDEGHFYHICRYIHLNPVDAGLVISPGDWSYSNYLEFVDERKGTLYDREFVNSLYANGEEYVKFVNEYAEEKSNYEKIEKYLF